MLGSRYIFLRAPSLVCVLIVAYSLNNFAGTVGSKGSSTTDGLGDQTGLNHFEQIDGKIEFIGTLYSRQKRSFPIYTCKRKSCDERGCKPESYHGPHPPKWCQRNPHKKQTKCSWTKSCMNKRCETQSTSCLHEFQELSNGKLQQKSTFNFECITRKNLCYVVQCKGITNCGKKTTISLNRFENEFLKKLPNCDEVDNKSGRRGRDTIDASLDNNEVISRRTRAPISVANLQGYCCEVGERFGGVKLVHVRPKIA